MVQVAALRFDVCNIAMSAQRVTPVIGNFFRGVPRPTLDNRARATVVVLGDDTKHAFDRSGMAFFEARLWGSSVAISRAILARDSSRVFAFLPQHVPASSGAVEVAPKNE